MTEQHRPVSEAELEGIERRFDTFGLGAGELRLVKEIRRLHSVLRQIAEYSAEDWAADQAREALDAK